MRSSRRRMCVPLGARLVASGSACVWPMIPGVGKSIGVHRSARRSRRRDLQVSRSRRSFAHVRTSLSLWLYLLGLLYPAQVYDESGMSVSTSTCTAPAQLAVGLLIALPWHSSYLGTSCLSMIACGLLSRHHANAWFFVARRVDSSG